MQLEIEKLEIDIASLRSSVEKKAAELQTTSNDLRQTDGDQERRDKLEVCFVNERHDILNDILLKHANLSMSMNLPFID